MASYADSTDMTNRYDGRTLMDLVSDTGVPETNLSSNSAMTTALSDATGAIRSALLVGGTYKPNDLTGLTGESAEYLKRITCEIALAYLILRRPEKYGKSSTEVREQMNILLDMFRSGVRVFQVDGNIAAGLPTIDGPTAVDYQNLNLLPDRTRNFYPNRKQRLPLGR